jgi:hypothetical protein
MIVDILYIVNIHGNQQVGGSHGHDRMVVEFTTTYAISAYRH